MTTLEAALAAAECPSCEPRLGPHYAEPLFAYMIEREAIRKRREAGQPRPWTDDPILQKGRFTNVRRSDDRTTRELLARFYGPNASGARPGDVLWHCAMARWFGRAEHVIALGWQNDWDPEAMVAAIRTRMVNGKGFFTGAYKIPVVDKREPHKEVDVCHNLLTPLWAARHRIAESAMQPCYGWENLCSQLRKFAGFGPFMAKEVAQDFILVTGWRPRDLNTFTPVGPGAREGLNLLRGRDVDWRKTTASRNVEWCFLKEVRDLFAVRDRYLPADFVELQLHDIQFNLCEYGKYGKYLRAKSGKGKLKRRYSR